MQRLSSRVEIAKTSKNRNACARSTPEIGRPNTKACRSLKDSFAILYTFVVFLGLILFLELLCYGFATYIYIPSQSEWLEWIEGWSADTHAVSDGASSCDAHTHTHTHTHTHCFHVAAVFVPTLGPCARNSPWYLKPALNKGGQTRKHAAV